MKIPRSFDKAQKVLAFFGADLKDRAPDFLQQACREGYTLLALDVPALGAAVAGNVPFTVQDDWLTSNDLQKAYDDSLACEDKWFESAREQLTSDGVCWPDLDRYALKFFWREVITARALVEKFFQADIQDLKFFQRWNRHPKVYYSPANIFGHYWQAELGKRTTVLNEQKAPNQTRQKPLWYRASRYVVSNVRGAVGPQNRDEQRTITTPANGLTEKIIVAINHHELFSLRFNGSYFGKKFFRECNCRHYL